MGNEQETRVTLLFPEEEMEVPKDLGKKATDPLVCTKWCVHTLTKLPESDTLGYKWLGINGSSDCCPDSTRISKIKAGTHRRAKSLGTWLLVGELAYLGHYLCGLDDRTSLSTRARRDT